MNEKKLHKLKKSELLELLISVSRENELLRKESQSDSDSESITPDVTQLINVAKKRRYRREYVRMIKSTINVLLVVAAIAVLIAMLWLPVLRVVGSSMEPSLKSDEIVLVSKNANFKRGDIVAFYYNNKILLKRIIGISGDIIDIKEDGTVYVNGEEIQEPYIEEKSLGTCDIEFPYEVLESRIFVMGDSRDTSIDSRSSDIGCIADDYILGKVVFRIWPFAVTGEI